MSWDLNGKIEIAHHSFPLKYRSMREGGPDFTEANMWGELSLGKAVQSDLHLKEVLRDL